MAAARPDPLACSGAFFGVTNLGATSAFADTAAASVAYPFHSLGEAAYEAAFSQHALAASASGRHVAQTLQVDAADSILRSKLGNALNTLLGRQALRAELMAFFTCLDFDYGGPVMSKAEWLEGCAQLRAWSAAPGEAREYSSHGRWQADRMMHRRVGWTPQAALQEPLTAAQAVGWHAPKTLRRPAEERHTLPHTDVTKREGTTKAHFFGELLA